MFTRTTCCSGCLIPKSACQHRNVATKLASKWIPPSPTPSTSTTIPSPNLGKWASPHSSEPSAFASATAPSKWQIPKLNPSALPPARSTPRSSQFQISPSHALVGKWARPMDLPIPQSDSLASSSASTDLRTRPRLDRDIAPHYDRIHPTFTKNSGAADRRRGVELKRHRYENSSEVLHPRMKSQWQQQTNPPEWIEGPRTSRGRERGVDARRIAQSKPDRGSQHGSAEALEPHSTSTRELNHLDGQESYTRESPRDRARHKNRGSLLDGGEIERRPRVTNLRSPKMRKYKPKPKVAVTEDIYIPTMVSVGQLSRLLGVRLGRLQRKMIEVGMAEDSSYDHVLTSEYASLIVLEFDKNPIINDEAAFDIFPPPPHPEPSTLPQRPPIVTVMGHVDHGKTTLLDTLRCASVAKGEAGGITQHIGAFSVPVSSSNDVSQTITFLDTPGHAAFSAMRARGASVTDIVVLVVAADDSVMPQTREVIELVKKDEGKVGVVVAINKIDKSGVDPEAIKNALLAEGVQLEAFGGDIPSVEVSGLTGQGLDRLIETISAVAEIADYRAERKGPVYGYVLESKVLKGLGPVATVLVLRGDLTPAKNLISGTAYARVRHISDATGKVVKAAYPGMAVTVSGWKELPKAGDEVMQGSETDIKKAIANRRRRSQLAAVVRDAEAINIQRRLDRERKEDVESSHPDSTTDKAPEESGHKELRLVIKGDVSGSIEALEGAFQGISNKIASINVVQSSVGNVTESDVMMAKTAGGTIVAFSVAVPRAIETMAAANDVPILTSSVIYQLMDDIKQRVVQLLPPIIEKRVTGEATVQQLFDIHLKRHQVIKVAGCRITNGLIERNKPVRVMRNGEAIHEGPINTLRHLKKDVVELRKDMECGLSLDKFDDLREGDIIQAIQVNQRPGIL